MGPAFAEDQFDHLNQQGHDRGFHVRFGVQSAKAGGHVQGTKHGQRGVGDHQITVAGPPACVVMANYQMTVGRPLHIKFEPVSPRGNTIGEGRECIFGKVDAVALTGGIAYSERFVNLVKSRVDFIAPVLLFPGEQEMRALAFGGLRVLRKEEKAKEYNPNF